ncbi:MAG: amidohydrolase, partial [Oscillospiraceae bacterium]|nr:amidohydrolase [Oscillospiraceae bacterium]
MSYFSKALLEKENLLHTRRYLHRNAEAGLQLPKTMAFIKDTLHQYGIEATPCGHGLSALIGSGGKTILLRADADALPMQEESGLPFACPKDAAHTCGHDLHTAMLLTAAKLLKEDEARLKGTVKLMFQPAEETFEGSRNMMENGILRDPVPDAALALHVSPGRDGVGLFRYNDASAAMFSVDGFRITVRGRGSHGAYPQYAVD